MHLHKQGEKTLEIKQPLCITPRLLPGCRIGEAWISIEYSESTLGRQYYRWYIDLDIDNTIGQVFADNQLCSGANGGTLQEGLESLLGFLRAFAEAWANRTYGTNDSMSLFRAELADWAIENEEEIACLECDLQEHPNEFIVE